MYTYRHDKLRLSCVKVALSPLDFLVISQVGLCFIDSNDRIAFALQQISAQMSLRGVDAHTSVQ